MIEEWKQANPLNLKDWLGGLDSNQDSQIQNLKSCQLDDLPAGLRNLRGIGAGHTEDTAKAGTKTNRSTFPVRDSHDSSLSD